MARSVVRDLRGGVRLAIDGVTGVVGVVESLHQRIAGVAPPLGQVPDVPTRGITGFVYRAIRGTTGLVGSGLDAALAGLQTTLPAADGQPTPARDAVVSALNGVVGDHLHLTGNPLATATQLRLRDPLAGPVDAGAIDAATARPHLLLLVHGLCMNDHQWTRRGHDHGQALARAMDATPVYARYNSGRHISINGRELAAALDRLARRWPVPLEAITIVGHSMGGLVARSAVHQATQGGMAWLGQVRSLVFLGSPHHGAPLERSGNWLHRGLGISPYLAPFTRLTGLRSEGITDLRHGNLLDEDWAGGRFAQRDGRAPVPLPAGVASYTVAGTVSDGWIGDGLVPLDSALGRHTQAALSLGIPPRRQWVARGVNHLDLLSDAGVYRQLKEWLAP